MESARGASFAWACAVLACMAVEALAGRGIGTWHSTDGPYGGHIMDLAIGPDGTLYAAAGPENHRYPWGDAWKPVCDDYRAPKGLIGAFPGCRTPTGVRDLGVETSWATLDPQTR
ncbi:hypothetical protein CMK11_11560, partial [Candidatus Poribacteria bacterium]|nr:hypothetical protein [Candidatus Poribacteria bacterium]